MAIAQVTDTPDGLRELKNKPLGEYELRGYGVRISYYGATVSTCQHRMTRENLSAAVDAFLILTGANVYVIEDLQIDFYRAS